VRGVEQVAVGCTDLAFPADSLGEHVLGDGFERLLPLEGDGGVVEGPFSESMSRKRRQTRWPST
jgi:hypothetical protein